MIGRRIPFMRNTNRNPFLSCIRKFSVVIFTLLLCITLYSSLTEPVQVEAATNPVSITSCRLNGTKKIRITATVSNMRRIGGSRCYLFALTPGSSRISSSARPIASARKANKMTFSCPSTLNNTSLLYHGFAIASRNSRGKYTQISTKRYISNPGALARYRYRFPKAVSKKGLQINADMLEDAEELNVHNSVINIDFSQLLAPPVLRNSRYSYAWKYNGKTYWFVKDSVSYYDRQLQSLKSTSSVNSAVLLLSWRDDLRGLIYPQGRYKGHSFYAWNTANPAARNYLQATLNFLANRYSTTNGKYGRIVNWIVGNEVNNYWTYNYAGSKNLNQYAKVYADQFRLAYNALTSVYSNARVYISLDHLWNTNNVSGTFASRKMLDAFATRLRADGNIAWNLAYHPYSSPLTEPRFWANTNGQIRNSLSSPVINMGNIQILTRYIRQKYGSRTRIILSEQGYTSIQNGKNVEKLQAAAIAYSYLISESNNMIDSLIIHRQVDHTAEISQGLNLGLWTTSASSSSPENARSKKLSWNIYKYMDTSLSNFATSSLVSSIGGARSWRQLIPSYSNRLYNKVSCTIGRLTPVSGYKKTGSVSKSWTAYGASRSFNKKGDNFTIYRDTSRNQNISWGYTQSFKKNLNVSSSPRFCTTLRVTGATKTSVQIKIRFFCGKQYFECARNIPTRRTVHLSTTLANWKYRKNITKIQILAQPVSGASWKSGARFELTAPVLCR